MKTVLCFLVCFLALASCTTFEEENNVLVLNSKNFDEAISTFEYLLVEFYAPWCGHCQRLAPEYEKAAESLKDRDSKVRLAKVDATVEVALAQKYSVSGFPTIYMFVDGQPTPYTGGRTHLTILSWIKRKTEIASEYLSTVADVELAIQKLGVIVMFYGDELDRVFKMYWNVASRNMDVGFFHTTSREVMEKYNPKGDSKLSILRNFDEERVDFEDDFTERAIEKFVNKNRYPKVMNYNEKYAKMIFGDKNPAIFLLTGRGYMSEKALEALYAVAGELRGKIYIATCNPNPDNELCEKVAKYYGLKREDIPALTIFKPATLLEKPQRYLFDGPITEKNILQFYQDYASGKLTSLPKSEDIPDKNDDPVKVIVGRTFEDIVYDENKDVIVFLTKGGCQECRDLLGVFEGLAKLTLPVQNLILGKIDIEMNQVNGLKVTNVPQILFYPRNNKSEPVVYEGEKDIKSLYEFYKDKLTVEFDAGLIKIEDTLKEIERENKEKEEAAALAQKKMEDLQAAQNARTFNNEL